MGRSKGERNLKSEALQPKKKKKFKQRKIFHQEDEWTPYRNQKSQVLQPKKTKKFKQVKMLHQEDQRKPYPQLPLPPSQPLVCSDMKTENPCLDIVLVDDTGIDEPEAFAGTLPVSSLPPCRTTPSPLSIVPYKASLSSRTRSKWRTMNLTLSNCRNRKKLTTLSNHFNPIPFVREKPSDFATHQLLLTRLGLWNFLHLDFDRNIHSDLIKQLVVFYNPKKPGHRRSHVNGWPILVSRATLARSLALPTKRLNLHGNDAARAGPLMVSEEESMFVEKLVSSWMVLHDDSCELSSEVLKVKSLIRERRLENVDWAGLIWFMVKGELLKGDKLINCYYASHMQLLLKDQKPRLFRDHVKIAGFLDTGAAICDEENVDNSWSVLEGPKIVNNYTGLFSEEYEKQIILHVERNVVGVEESGRERKIETTFERCNQGRNSSIEQCMEGSTLYERMDTNDLISVDVDVDDCKGKKLQEPQTTVTQSPGDFEVELATCEVQDHNVDEKVSSEKLCTPYERSATQKEDRNSELKLLGGEYEIKLPTEDLYVGSSAEPDSLEKKLNVDFKCNEKQHQQGELTNLDMLVSEHHHDERMKMGCSSDFTASGMHVQSRLESEFEQMKLVPSHDKEKEFGIDAFVWDCKIIGEKLCTLDELRAAKVEDGNRELLLASEDKRKLSKGLVRAEFQAVKVKDGNKEVELLHHEVESKLSEGLLKEEIFDSRTVDLPDRQEKEENYGTDQESVSANNLVMNGESNEEILEAECSMIRMHSLSGHETNFHQMDMVLSEDKCEAELGLNILVEDHNVIDGKAFTSDEHCAIELENRSGKALQNELSEGMVEDEQFDGKTSELHESQENKVGDILISSKQHDSKMEDGDREPSLVHDEYENEFLQGLVKEEPCDARLGDSPDNQEVEVGYIAVNSTMDSGNQHTEIAIEDEKPDVLGLVEPETSGLNEIQCAAMDMQNKSALKSFVEPFAIERESFMNLDSSPLDNSLKREIDYLNDKQFERLNVTQKITRFSSAAGESFDLDLCSEEVELWMSRLKNAAQRCAQMDKEKNALLLKELETKNQIIEQYEKMRRQEQHKYQKNIWRFERELYLMKHIVDEYRTALKQVDKSFAEYRKRSQLLEEPIYVDHPDGGGKVVLATELKSLKLKQERENL